MSARQTFLLGTLVFEGQSRLSDPAREARCNVMSLADCYSFPKRKGPTKMVLARHMSMKECTNTKGIVVKIITLDGSDTLVCRLSRLKKTRQILCRTKSPTKEGIIC